MIKTSLILISFFILTASLSSQNETDTDRRLKELKIELPTVPEPVGSYVPFKRVGNLIYINQVALVNGKILTPGIIGENVTEEDAKKATQQTMLNIVAVLKVALNGNLDKVKQAVQITGIFNTTKGYTQHAMLMNSGSALLIDIFEDKGVHTRATFGASSIPIDSPVEIQAIFEVE